MLRSLKGQRTRLHTKIRDEILVGQRLVETKFPSECALGDLRDRAQICQSLLTKFGQSFETICEKIVEHSEGRPNEELDEEAEFVIDVETDIARITAQIATLISKLDIEMDKIERKNRPSESGEGLAALQHKIDKLVELQGLQSLSPDLSSSVLSESGVSRPGHCTRLPKLEFLKFSGDVLRFQEFWDSFDAAVHSNPSLRPVEKLNYLRAYLLGDAKQVISGISTCDTNYDVAIELVRKRFGDPQASVDAHYSRLTNLPPVANHTHRLRSFMDEVEKHLRCLSALGEDVEHRHFISLIMSKLPREVVVRLEETKEDDESWTVELLRKKLQSQLSARESAERQQYGSRPVDDRNSARTSRWTGNQPNSPRLWNSSSMNTGSTLQGLVAGERNSPKTSGVRCSLCSSDHFSDQCKKYKSLKERRQRLRGRCFICLSNSHQASQCQVKKACYYCKQVGRHNRCLCPSKFLAGNEASAVSAEESTESTDTNSQADSSSHPAISQHTVLASGDRVLLQTALVKVKNPNSSASVTTRVLLDSASNRSYISASLANKLQLPMSHSESFSVVTFGSEKPKTVETSICHIQVFQMDASSRVMDVNVVPKITGVIHRSPVRLPATSFLLKDLPLADSFPAEPESSPVDFLIGNDYYLDVITAEKMEIGGGLYLLGSLFGWILTGRIENSHTVDSDVTMFVNSFVNQSVPNVCAFTTADTCFPLKPSFEDFWRLESIGVTDSPEITDDDKAITQFNAQVKMVDRRYYVRWPWKDQFPDLPENYQLASGRLESLLRKFHSDSALLKRYADIIRDQESKGIIEKVTTASIEGPNKHYIPHHPVVSPTKSTTKVRIVYDASAKVRKRANSLNDCLLRGPVILEDMCGLLLRFRVFPIAIISDIEKAFLQVGLQVADRDVTRFLWLQDPSKPSTEDNLQVYRFCRVPFGIISSPFLLGATVSHHLLTHSSDTATKIKNYLYVDNVVTGVSSKAEASKFYAESKSIFRSASMNIREWASNCKEFMEALPDNDKVSSRVVKVLGVYWNTESDVMWVGTGSPEKMISAASKRQMFQALGSVFDPLGLFTPLTVRAKIFIHRLWEEKQDWDDPVNSKGLTDWRVVAEELSKIPNGHHPRFIGLLTDGETSIQLLCFCDASALAYSAVVYAKVSSICGVRISLVFAKSRLAPSKMVSIPRMELLAVLIGVRCLTFVERQLRIPIEKKIIWTDSQCVLHWLNSNKPLTVFVENRLREIRKSNDISFRFISGRENPADIATRGQYSYDDVNASDWWTGPPWASNDEKTWPVWPYDIPYVASASNETESLNASGAALIFVTHDGTFAPYGISVERYSTLLKLYRVTAWISRFISKTRKRPGSSGMLDAAEIGAAKLQWDRHIQQKSFGDIFSAIAKGTKCSLKEQLNIKTDDSGILRCYGRFLQSDLQSKFPKLLPRSHHYTSLVIRHFHTRLFHSGVNHTLSQIRTEYWIPQGRSAVRRYISACVTCRRMDGGPYSLPPMPPLPVSRVSRSSPFSYVGLDYLGPLFVKLRSQQRQKVWVCLFTCMGVRAIHLELAEDLSADQFMLVLRRFIARRGKPIQIISDNASQFKMSKNCIDRLWSQVLSDADVKSYVGSEGISWKFIVERAPWMGGFYERLVGSVKRSLKRAIGRICLTMGQLTTILTEIEAVLNSRPLFYVGDDNQQPFSITPSDFLCLNPATGIPSCFDNLDDPPYIPSPTSTDNLLTTWKKGHKLLELFWKVWHDDYLAALRERSIQRHRQGRIVNSVVPRIGDVVLVKDDNVSRGCWKLGRIDNLMEGGDGQVRAAQVQFSSGNILSRPIKLLYPLEDNSYNNGCKSNNDSSTNNNESLADNNIDDNNNNEAKNETHNRKELPRRLAGVKAKQWLKKICKDLTEDTKFEGFLRRGSVANKTRE